MYMKVISKTFIPLFIFQLILNCPVVILIFFLFENTVLLGNV